jgi:protein-S-isoprenylcysteine O-methyltransferase Ste14
MHQLTRPDHPEPACSIGRRANRTCRVVNDMPALRTGITIVWIAFWLYWWASAVGVKPAIRGRRRFPLTSQQADAELVTSGPYRAVRHPIYSGLLAGLLGTALATNLIGLIIVAVLGAYFYYSACVEEKNLTATFRTAYPVYRTSTKMLIPFVL